MKKCSGLAQADFALPAARRSAREFDELPRHMGLVGVAACRGDFRPSADIRRHGEFGRVAEAHDAGEQFRRQADIVAKCRYEALSAPAKVAGDVGDALVAPARAQDRDRFFTYITSIAEENALINSGSNAGLGIRLAYDQVARRVFVLEAFESAPAFAQGIDRGSEIIAIGGQTVDALMKLELAAGVDVEIKL